MKYIKKVAYIIPGLAVTGMFDVQAGDALDTAKSDVLEQAKTIAASISDQHQFSLASHSSHASHGSHGSHSSHASHSSGGVSSLVDIEEDTLLARNLNSTPTSTILPSSPAILESERDSKLKRLPGNSAKFTQIVERVQLALSTRGFDVDFDGQMGARTISAIYQYQEKLGITSNGKLTPETLSSLGVVAS